MAVVDLSLSDIFEDAFEQAGTMMSGGYDLKTARRSLTILLNEWSNRGLNLWTVEEGTIACVASTGTYTLPVDTIDIIDHSIRSLDGLTDYTIRRMAVGEWSQLSKKSQTGRPTSIFVERLTAPQLHLWPVPDEAYTLVYWRMRRMESISSGIAGDPDLPSRFVPALIAGLALRIARAKQNYAAMPELKLEYEQQFMLAAGEDRDRSAYRLRPAGLLV